MFLLVYLCGTHFSECVPIYMNFIIFCIFKGKSMTFFRNCITFIDLFLYFKVLSGWAFCLHVYVHHIRTLRPQAILRVMPPLALLDSWWHRCRASLLFSVCETKRVEWPCGWHQKDSDVQRERAARPSFRLASHRLLQCLGGLRMGPSGRFTGSNSDPHCLWSFPPT